MQATEEWWGLNEHNKPIESLVCPFVSHTMQYDVIEREQLPEPLGSLNHRSPLALTQAWFSTI
jgi:hypothetical protein